MLPLELFENSLFFLVPKWGIMSCIRNNLTMSIQGGRDIFFLLQLIVQTLQKTCFGQWALLNTQKICCIILTLVKLQISWEPRQAPMPLNDFLIKIKLYLSFTNVVVDYQQLRIASLDFFQKNANFRANEAEI